MARTALEDRCFSDYRIRVAAKLLDWDQSQVLGVLAYLWHDSQEQLEVEAPREKIELWLSLNSSQCSKKTFDVFLEVGYLSKGRQPDCYRIHGNHLHVKKLKKLRESARRGGKANAKQMLNQTLNQKASQKGSANPNPNPNPNPNLTITSTDPADAGMTPQDLVNLWNENRGTYPAVKTLTDKRKRAAKARLRENAEPGYWLDVINKLVGWRITWDWKGPDFDYLLRPDTHVNAVEGKYGDSNAALPELELTEEDLEQERRDKEREEAEKRAREVPW